MTIERVATVKRDSHSENFAAELTEAAYRVALQRGLGDKWLELQLDLWAVMTQAIEALRLTRWELSTRETTLVHPLEVDEGREAFENGCRTVPKPGSQERPFSGVVTLD